MLRVVVLGAAAGGGVPQWNCGCRICRLARTEHPELQSTQASIAISADGDHWFLVNASPDLRQQISATPQLHPAAGKLREISLERGMEARKQSGGSLLVPIMVLSLEEQTDGDRRQRAR